MSWKIYQDVCFRMEQVSKGWSEVDNTTLIWQKKTENNSRVLAIQPLPSWPLFFPQSFRCCFFLWPQTSTVEMIAKDLTVWLAALKRSPSFNWMETDVLYETTHIGRSCTQRAKFQTSQLFSRVEPAGRLVPFRVYKVLRDMSFWVLSSRASSSMRTCSLNNLS